MTKLRKGNEEITINCVNRICGNCVYIPIIPEQKCKLFNVLLDHVVTGSSKNSGWNRCTECINAEVKK